MDERHRVSRAQEERTAKRHGGRRQSGSGNQPLRRGDVRTDTELIECKIRVKSGAKSITIQRDTLDKVFVEAWSTGVEPAVLFDLGRPYVIITEAYLLDLKAGAGRGSGD